MFKIAICDDVEDVCRELKTMHLNLNYIKGRLILRIENSYLNVNLVRGNFLTTKKIRKGMV